VDIFCFLSFPENLPFKRLVSADNSLLPAAFNIDKTSSLKNNFADKRYSEGLINRKNIKAEEKLDPRKAMQLSID
jgi:hypothetical protein